MKLRKRGFANTVLLHCNRLIYELLEDDSSTAHKELQETIGNHCFDVIRKRGKRDPQEINDFRKEMIEMVLGIVQSDNPIISMRKELIGLIHTSTLNHTFFMERFADRRKELYAAFNKEEGNAEIVNSDDTASVLFIWSEAECCILRMLQHTHFETVGEDDWFSAYSEAYQTYIEMLFELILSKKDEKDFSINGVLFPVFRQQIKASQQKLIGEVIEYST